MRLIFFFQAEDGIRDADVTGVQTCALPIYELRGAGQHGRPPPLAPLSALRRGPQPQAADVGAEPRPAPSGPGRVRGDARGDPSAPALNHRRAARPTGARSAGGARARNRPPPEKPPPRDRARAGGRAPTAPRLNAGST